MSADGEIQTGTCIFRNGAIVAYEDLSFFHLVGGVRVSPSVASRGCSSNPVPANGRRCASPIRLLLSFLYYTFPCSSFDIPMISVDIHLHVENPEMPEPVK